MPPNSTFNPVLYKLIVKFTKSPETFFVEEILRPELMGGKYYYYIMEKRGIDSANAVKILENENKTHVSFSGLKDANASTRQWVCSAKELAPPKNAKIKLEFRGMSHEKIYVGMHSANRFTLKLEGVSGNEQKTIAQISKTDFPNYFDDQRFSPLSVKLGKCLFAGNWEGAMKCALTEISGKESEKSAAIKKHISENWGRWDLLAEHPEMPNSKKAIFRALLESNDFKKEVILLERKTVSIACRAFQAEEFNRSLSEGIKKQNAREQGFIEINSVEFPVKFSARGIKRKITIVPVFPRRTKLERKTFFNAQKVSAKFAEGNCTLKFELRKGSYATILVKCLGAYCKK